MNDYERGKLAIRLRRAGIMVCNWTVDVDGIWSGDCGIRWECSFETPKDNGMNYCPRCGKRLKQKWSSR
jgi:hypothetical protein